jgi:CxxC motif-containing protein (DUF1111 family)
MKTKLCSTIVSAGIFALAWSTGTFTAQAAPAAAASVFDPGVRATTGTEGAPLTGLSTNERAFFDAGKLEFSDVDGLAEGLGPRFNLDGCVACHQQPAIGGTSPATNPQVAVATAFGAQNTVPSFVSLQGPVREARFRRDSAGAPDGSVHNLFVITGRNDGSISVPNNCNISQEDFAAQIARENVIFRIPTPVFGLGLIEEIPDSAIIANLAAGASPALGISGHVNRNGNDQRVSRIGWKAQNPSGLVFAGEAYNVEMGITNEAFQIERDETPSCQFATVPNAVTKTAATTPTGAMSNIELFADFMRFLAPPTPSTTSPGGAASITNGKSIFSAIGCALCHTPSFTTGNATVAALRNQPVNLFSDLAVHRMGPGLADGVQQGAARGDEFRTAPLWGLGQRIFLLHDGRTSNLIQAILAHYSTGEVPAGNSEANAVIVNFANLAPSDQQDLVNFLRSL